MLIRDLLLLAMAIEGAPEEEVSAGLKSRMALGFLDVRQRVYVGWLLGCWESRTKKALSMSARVFILDTLRRTRALRREQRTRLLSEQILGPILKRLQAL